MGKYAEIHTPSQIEILASLCSPDPGRHVPALEQIQANNLDWAELLIFAQQHQVSPLLYRCITLHGGHPSLSPIQHAQLRQTCRNIKMHNLRTETELLRISSLLNAAKIQHLVYKGPALARQVFGDLGLRQFNDFDLLTSEADTYRVAEMMKDAGYEPIVPLNNIQKTKLHYFEKEITYIKEERGQRRFEADIHWMLLRPALNVSLKFESLWKHAVITKFGDAACHTLNPTYTFLTTCIHNGGNEAWHTLKQVADLDAIMRQWIELIDWNEVWRIAKHFDMELLISSSVLLTNLVFETPMPEDVKSRASGNAKAVAIAASLKTFPNPVQLTRWPAIREHLRIRGSIWTKMRILGHSLLETLSPNYADEQFLRIPEARRFFGLYYFIRPLRILLAGKNTERF